MAILPPANIAKIAFPPVPSTEGATFRSLTNEWTNLTDSSALGSSRFDFFQSGVRVEVLLVWNHGCRAKLKNGKPNPKLLFPASPLVSFWAIAVKSSQLQSSLGRSIPASSNALVL